MVKQLIFEIKNSSFWIEYLANALQIIVCVISLLMLNKKELPK